MEKIFIFHTSEPCSRCFNFRLKDSDAALVERLPKKISRKKSRPLILKNFHCSNNNIIFFVSSFASYLQAGYCKYALFVRFSGGTCQVFWWAGISIVFKKKRKDVDSTAIVLIFNIFSLCTPSGTRTLDPLIKSQLLYQLS